MSGIAQFPPASLTRQLAELERERSDRRDTRDPFDLATKRATRVEIDHRNSALDGAIATLQRLVDAQKRGEPGRAELVAALREAVRLADAGSVVTDAIRDVLAKVPT